MRRDGEKPRRDSGLSPPRQPGSPTATALHPRASRRAPWTVTASRPAVPSWALASAPDSLSVNPVDSDLNSRESGTLHGQHGSSPWQTCFPANRRHQRLTLTRDRQLCDPGHGTQSIYASIPLHKVEQFACPPRGTGEGAHGHHQRGPEWSEHPADSWFQCISHREGALCNFC